MKTSNSILKGIWKNRILIFRLGKNDFKTRFSGSVLGTVWAFVQPMVTVLVYWFVFQVGLKSPDPRTRGGISIPFVLWLIAGIVPWFFFNEALNGGTNALLDYNYLVKKVVFQIEVLPMVKIFSALFVHAFFVIFALVLFACYGFFPDLYTLQILYYSFALVILLIGLTYLTSAIVVFFRDLSQIINIALQIGIWVTPIMWNIETMNINPVLIIILKLNPLYYIVAGYRDALVNKMWFWENPKLTIYYWVLTLIVLFIGTRTFKKLRVHFADVI